MTTELEAAWNSEYDYPNRRVTLTLADNGPIGQHWSGIRKDESLSDPAGAFDVFIAHDPSGEPTERPRGPIVKVVAHLDDQGDLVCPHPDFDTNAIGSMTIWPYRIAGERLGLDHWMWWSSGPIFRDGPRSWAEAARSR